MEIELKCVSCNKRIVLRILTSVVTFAFFLQDNYIRELTSIFAKVDEKRKVCLWKY